MGKIPSKFKPAQSGEEQIDWVLYDTVLSTTNASSTLTYFANTEAGQSLDVTNLTTPAQLPSTQRFICHEINVYFNDVSAAADEVNLLDRASFLLTVNNKRMFSCPLRHLIGPQTTLPSGVSLDESFAVGQAFKLMNSIAILGGENFSATIVTGDTAASASTAITVALVGELVRPSGA